MTSDHSPPSTPAPIHPNDMLELVDLEEYAKAGKHPPRARRYRIRIDKVKYEVNSPMTTGRALLALAGKQPVDRYRIDQKLHGGQTKQIGLDQTVDLTTPGVERFMTLPLDQTEGEGPVDLAPLRRQFELPAEDTEQLEALGLPWETITANGSQWLLVHRFPLPAGYTATTASVGVLVTPGYPTAPLDMVYFHPALGRRDDRQIAALSSLSLDGRIWQRWSRHRTTANPWRPGVDDIAAHLRLVEHWLAREFTSAARAA